VTFGESVSGGSEKKGGRRIKWLGEKYEEYRVMAKRSEEMTKGGIARQQLEKIKANVMAFVENQHKAWR